ncbi:MAG: single-stranded DNA-binding protein [Planctomycetaceae bacterium]|nr:single-stranded DNA-binding protein [Planctomycetaceae bacterium]MBQ2821309.1 single-stranded DNA-binding protein [Thermoguttaceae bacterium]MDO4426034.1 single-stranded DNA-binding protein [Planctomycetia bacterium]
MASFNRVILVGNLTRDPDLRYTPSGMPVCELGLAVNDRRKTPDGEWIEEATFIDVTFWAKQAEVCSQYLSKGSPVLVEGRLKMDQWEQDGAKRSKLRVVGERMQMLGTRSAGNGGQPPRSTRNESEAYGSYDSSYSQMPPQRSTPQGDPGPGTMDDIPF